MTRILAALLLMILVLSAGATTVTAGKVYGDQAPAEAFYPYLTGNWRGASFNFFEPSIAIFVHVIGDPLRESEAQRFFSRSLAELDQQTRAEGLVFWTSQVDGVKALSVSADSLERLIAALDSNQTLQSAIETLTRPELSEPFTPVDLKGVVANKTWSSSGYAPVVFPGLFANPDYPEPGIFLMEDEQTSRTPQVTAIAGLINDQRDISTLKEIHNLIQAIAPYNRLGQ